VEKIGVTPLVADPGDTNPSDAIGAENEGPKNAVKE